MSHVRLYILIVACAVTLAACSGGARSEPEMIASFPSSNASNPQPVNPPPPAQYVYNAYLELEVSKLDRVSDRAIDLAYQYNGYLVNWQTWRSGDASHVSLVLAVPAANFDTAYNALSRLGEVVSQYISGEWVSSRPGDGWNVYSEITVQLNDLDTAWSPQIGGWHPLRTLSSAWDVFTAIFGFLADVIIWLVVVLGPFLVLVFILYRVIKRLHRTP